MLDTVPSEVLTQIAYHLSLPTLQPPLSLLLTSKSIHAALSSENNPNLYARIFRSSFDTAAAERRVGGEIHAGNLARELQLRVKALGRLRRVLERKDVSSIRERDLWVVFVLLVEHDWYNLSYLLRSDSPTGFHLPTFLKLYHDENLLPAAVEPGYPADTPGRALTMWIAWLLRWMKVDPVIETPVEREERLFVLRPYVFAAQQYEVYYAPWTVPDLPLSQANHPKSSPYAGLTPFIADLSLKSRKVDIEYYGRTISISTPLLSQAAILTFFHRNQEDDEDLDDDDDVDEDEEEDEVESEDEVNPQFASGSNPTQVDLVNDMMANRFLVHDPAPTSSHLGNRAPVPGVWHPAFNGGSNSQAQIYGQSFKRTKPARLSSSTHDRDWARLRNCFDPSTCPGMQAKAWRGAFAGCWEGNFSFFEFEAFREMLAGQSRALYEGPFGQQAQVWKLYETFVRPKWVRPVIVDEGKGKAKQEEEDTETGDDGENAMDDKVEDKGKGKGLPLNGPITNAGFPTDQPPSTSAGLATAAAEALTLKETIRQQVEAVEGYEIVPDEELDEELDLAEEGGKGGVEVLLTGTGHSAWGRFILKGRVRIWDGMATLVKEYAPDSRGKWIYRGYILQGDIFVGRWRDTFTPEAYIGYEGTFILNRRR